MVASPVLQECLLELALQRNLQGFQQSLKRTLEQFNLKAWAVVFPPPSELSGRPLFMAHGIRPENSPLLGIALKQGLDAVFPAQGSQSGVLTTLARQMSPEPTSRCRILRTRHERGGEFIMFCYRSVEVGDFAPGEFETLTQVGRLLDRCFSALAEAQEREFEAGLFRMVGNLHPEGLCVLDNRLRVLFENRKFKEHMHVWHHGLRALQALSLPKQSELPLAWREACDGSFKAFREVKFPASAERGKMIVSQGAVSSLRHVVGSDSWVEGAVRYIAFQSPLGVRPYLLLTSALRQERPTANVLTIDRIAQTLGFSRRETELAELILRGDSAAEIARHLKIAMPTVKTHIRHILHKAGVKTRLQFVGLCRPRT